MNVRREPGTSTSPQRTQGNRAAVLYARVSSKDQEREGYSIPAQQRLLRKYARAHGLTIAKEFVDVETAKQAGRAGFGAMLAFLKADQSCRTILVEKTDRLYRNFTDYVTVEELKITVCFVKENTIISPDSRSSDKLLHDIKVAMAKNYSDNLSEEVKKGLQEKVNQGHWPHRAHIGYHNNRETRLIDPDPERAPAVRRLFERYAAGGISLKALAASAFADGLTYPRSGKRMTASEVHRLLRNPIYYGAFRWKGKLYVGSHEPIVSKALFDQAQRRLAAANRPRYRRHQHAFAGLLDCGLCGCSITAETKKQKYVYYHCTGYRGHCGNTYVRQEDLGALLGEVVHAVQIPPETAEEIAEALREIQADKVAYQQEAVQRLALRRDSLQAKLDRAYDDLLDGTISKQLWSRKTRAWEADLDATVAELSGVDRASADYMVTGAKILELSQCAYSLYVRQDPTEQRRLLETLLSNCTFERGTLTPTYNKPFDLFARGNKTKEWRRGQSRANPSRHDFGQVPADCCTHACSPESTRPSRRDGSLPPRADDFRGHPTTTSPAQTPTPTPPRSAPGRVSGTSTPPWRPRLHSRPMGLGRSRVVSTMLSPDPRKLLRPRESHSGMDPG